MNLNSVTLAGRLAKPPVLLYREKDDTPVLRFVLIVEDVNDQLNKTFKVAIP